MDLVKPGVRIIRNKGFRIFRINMVLKQYRKENTFLLIAEMIFASNENCKAVSPNRGEKTVRRSLRTPTNSSCKHDKWNQNVVTT